MKLQCVVCVFTKVGNFYFFNFSDLIIKFNPCIISLHICNWFLEHLYSKLVLCKCSDNDLIISDI